MTQEDKQLLLKDLCARLPYDVKVCIKLPNHQEKIFEEYIGDLKEITRYGGYLVNSKGVDYRSFNLDIKPYLRPMSSMTEEEKEELYHYYCNEIADNLNTPNLTWEVRCCVSNSFGTDWLNAHHFDYHNLIEKGLALEAPEGMYNIKEQ